MKIQQVKLSDKTQHEIVCWIPADLHVKPGNIVKGKDHREWHVLEVYTTIHESEDIHSDWRVGGL